MSRRAAALLVLLGAGGCVPHGEAPATARFVAIDDAVVRDTRTGLEWTARDHEQDLRWDDADRHCRELALGGRAGWRLPDLEELKALYDEGVRQRCGERSCHLDPLIDLAGPYVWSATGSPGMRRHYIDFQYGTTFAPTLHPGLVRRTVCVRSPAG